MSKSIFMRADSLPDRWLLPTPSLGLTTALNGGFQAGMIHTLWGTKASGKTSLAMHCIGEAQRMGKRCLYVDAEKTFSKHWAQRCGVILPELDICFQSRVETILAELLPKLNKNEVDLVVVDSLSSIYFEGYFDKTDNKAIGTGARSQNLFVSKVLEALDPFNTQVFLIAHQANANAGGQSMSLQAKISESVKMWSSSIIKFRKDLSKEEYREVPNRMTIHWEIEKSKWSNYPVSGKYFLWAKPNENVEFDNVSELARLAIELDLLEQKGAWFNYGDQKFHGEDKFTEALKNDADLFAQIEKEVFNNG